MRVRGWSRLVLEKATCVGRVGTLPLVRTVAARPCLQRWLHRRLLDGGWRVWGKENISTSECL
jgi:hypothetical protein